MPRGEPATLKLRDRLDAAVRYGDGVFMLAADGRGCDTPPASVPARAFSKAARRPTWANLSRPTPHFYSDEGTEPPHIHFCCVDAECKFWLDMVALARNRGVPAHTMRDIERLVCEHVDLLLEQCDAHHPSGNRSRGDQSLD